ncbi:MAG: phosphatidate cytidylyltransferase [Eubacterium sp.]|nr:phosphatidate cytidylyltransferase [Eubacterium sp.]
MFAKRLVSGVLLLAALIALLAPGGYITLIALTCLSLMGLYELYRVFDMHKSIVGIMGYLCTLLYYANIYFKFYETDRMFIIIFLMLSLFVYVFRYPTFKIGQIAGTFFGLFYVSIMLSFIFLIRDLPDGVYMVWLVFLCSWGCDTCAYCVGMLLGKHKFAPLLSPKKSVEGAIGGIIGAALLGALYGAVLFKFFGFGENCAPEFAIICGCAAFFSQLGDLAASGIKRDYGIKDYSNLIPGHGGVLDRFDSVIITAPMIYYLAIYFLDIK